MLTPNSCNIFVFTFFYLFSWSCNGFISNNQRLPFRQEISRSSAVVDIPSNINNKQPESQANHYGPMSMTVEELAHVLGGYGRAQLVWDYYSIGVDPQLWFGNNNNNNNNSMTIMEEPTDISRLLPSTRRTKTLGAEALRRLASITPGACVEGGVASLCDIRRSRDRTTKLLLTLEADGTNVETVIIPMNEERSTLCISSQVGCRQGCTFCATGRMGKLRSLSSDEILVQMYFARKICRLEQLPPVTNVVFMGMGEPADNAEQVIRASQILTTRGLFQLSAGKVTISTVAPTPESFRILAEAGCVLAWSVHAANDQLRRQLVPTTKYAMTELRQGLIEALRSRRTGFQRTVMLEVALIRGINDGLEQAKELAEFCRPIFANVAGCKLIVNLIMFNDVNGVVYQAPLPENVDAFQKELWKHGICAHVRTTRGDDESAACGQLATLKRQPKNKM